MAYQHRFYHPSTTQLPVGKVVCVGRNYLKHIEELNNAIPDESVLFIKPASSLVSIDENIILPENTECHHEVELAILIGKPLRKAEEKDVQAAIAGYGIALDLTLREVQQQLKEKGLPWERAKAFDKACPISPFIATENFICDPQQIEITLTINGKLRQHSNTKLMITPINALISLMSQHFTLMPGDVVLTGTPEGVAALKKGDQLCLSLAEQYRFTTQTV